jgi:hypothetical protein
MDFVIVVGSNERFSDENVQVWNGNNALSFPGFDSIDFYGIADHTQYSKADKKRNNFAFLYGFCASSFNDSHDSNGVHCPNVRSNSTGCLHIGFQLIAMSQLIRDIDPEETCEPSSPGAMIRHEHCDNLLVSTGIDASLPGKDNILDAFTEATNICNICNHLDTKMSIQLELMLMKK